MENSSSKDFYFIEILAKVYDWSDSMYINVLNNIQQLSSEWKNSLDKEVNEYFSKTEQSLLKLYYIDSKSSIEMAEELSLSLYDLEVLIHRVVRRIHLQTNINTLLSLVIPAECSFEKVILCNDLFKFLLDRGIKIENLSSKDFDFIEILAKVYKWPESLYIAIKKNIQLSNLEWRNLLDKEVNEYFSKTEQSILKLFLIDLKSFKEIAKELNLSLERTKYLLDTAAKKIDSRENININILLSLVTPAEYVNEVILCHDLFNFISEIGIKSAKKIIKNDTLNLSFRKGIDPKSIPIEDLKLSALTCIALNRADIFTLADILNKSEKELLGIRKICKKHVKEILYVIENLELQLPPNK